MTTLTSFEIAFRKLVELEIIVKIGSESSSERSRQMMSEQIFILIKGVFGIVIVSMKLFKGYRSGVAMLIRRSDV